MQAKTHIFTLDHLKTRDEFRAPCCEVKILGHHRDGDSNVEKVINCDKMSCITRHRCQMSVIAASFVAPLDGLKRLAAMKSVGCRAQWLSGWDTQADFCGFLVWTPHLTRP